MIFRRRTPAPLSATEAQDTPPPLPGAWATTQPGSFWAKITGRAAGTNRYAWEQIDDGDTAAFNTGLAVETAARGTSDEDGGCAYEVNSRTDVPIGKRVRLWPAGDLTYYTFAYEGEGAPCVGCGWVDALTADDCLLVSVESAGGRCACAIASVFKIESADGEEWTNGTHLLTICDVTYQVTFSREGCDGPCLTLVEVPAGSGSGPLATFAAKRGCCGKNYATFAFGDTALCTEADADGGPSENLLLIKVEWSTCGGGDSAAAVVEADPGDLPVAISDLAVAQLAIDVADVPSASSLRQLVLAIDHPAVGQLVVLLEDPDGNVIQLVNALPTETGTSTSTGLYLAVVDNAELAVQNQGTTPGQAVTGVFYPLQPLTNLAGAPNGVWTIYVQDTATGSTGTIEYASLAFAPSDCPMDSGDETFRIPCCPDYCLYFNTFPVEFSGHTGDCGAYAPINVSSYGTSWDFEERKWKHVHTNPPSASNHAIRVWCDGTTWHSTATWEGQDYTGVFVSADCETGEIVFDYTFTVAGAPCVGNVRFTFTNG